MEIDSMTERRPFDTSYYDNFYSDREWGDGLNVATFIEHLKFIIADDKNKKYVELIDDTEIKTFLRTSGHYQEYISHDDVDTFFELIAQKFFVMQMTQRALAYTMYEQKSDWQTHENKHKILARMRGYITSVWLYDEKYKIIDEFTKLENIHA